MPASAISGASLLLHGGGGVTGSAFGYRHLASALLAVYALERGEPARAASVSAAARA